MMLTDEEIRDLDIRATFENWSAKQHARAVIEASNAKVLADLKPVQERIAVKMYGYAILAEIAAKEDLYSAETVSALIQDRDSLAARVKELNDLLAKSLFNNLMLKAQL